MPEEINLNGISISEFLKERILNEFISAECQMSNFEGDDHSAVVLHRAIATLVIPFDKISEVCTIIYDNCEKEISEIKEILKSKNLLISN